LTYFPLLVTEKRLGNEWLVSAGPRTGTVIALAAQARSHGAAES
jgi:hypothetical protein